MEGEGVRGKREREGEGSYPDLWRSYIHSSLIE